MREQQRVPPAGAGAERADADEVRRLDGIGGEVGEVGPERDVDVGRQLGEAGDLGLERGAQAVHQVVPQRLLLRRLGRAALLLEALVHVVGIDAEERERPAILRGRVGDAPLVLEDQDPLRVVGREHALELRRVLAALDRVGRDRLHAGVRRAADAVRHARAEALDRIAEHDQQLRVGRGARDQPRRPEVVHVARRPLAGDLPRACAGSARGTP